jgi:hypothetical protein
MTKPEPEEAYWRLRCQGRLKLGSLCTVNTCRGGALEGSVRL